MIDAAAIDITRPSPPITASQSQDVSSLSRPSTNTCFGISGSACTARASAHSEARKILSRSIREGEAKATANDAVAQISSNSFSRCSAVSRLKSSMPFGNPLRIEHHGRGDHRPRQRPAPGLVAARDRPHAALDQRALAAKARRRHRDDALRQLGRLVCDLSRIMPGWCCGSPGRATGNSGVPVIQTCLPAKAGPITADGYCLANCFRRGRRLPHHDNGVYGSPPSRGRRVKTNSAAARCASAARNARW